MFGQVEAGIKAEVIGFSVADGTLSEKLRGAREEEMESPIILL